VRLTWLHRGTAGVGIAPHADVAAAPRWPGEEGLIRRLERLRNWLTDAHQQRTLVILLLGVALGVFLVAQWESPSPDAVADPSSRDAAIQRTIARLEAEQAGLKKQIAELRARAAADQRAAAQSQSAVASLHQALAAQRTLAGTSPVQGPGIDILLDDSTVRTLLPSDDPDNYIVHEYQIRDIVNVLWGAGAVAIAVNNERFVNSTSVYCVGSTILINDTRTSPPYHIVAIGDIAAMQRALDDSSNLRDLKARVQTYGLVFKIARTGTMTVPGYDGSIHVRYAAVDSSASRPAG
jgi:uncharacterized protein YlxW (UPF0749 family)